MVGNNQKQEIIRATPKKNRKEEIWKPIHKKYKIPKVMISNLGNCRGLNGRNLKPKLKPNGYLWTLKNKKGDIKQYYAHRIVARTFLKKKKKHKYVRHLDGDVSNNRVENLKWVTKVKSHEGMGDGPKIRIKQLTLTGDLVRKWCSIKETKAGGFNPDQVSRCTRGLIEYYKGYKWERDEKKIIGEIWKSIEIEKKVFIVSNMGRVRLNKNGQISNKSLVEMVI